jgi:hypothetical protein
VRSSKLLEIKNRFFKVASLWENDSCQACALHGDADFKNRATGYKAVTSAFAANVMQKKH